MRAALDAMTSNVPAQLGARVRELRKALDLTQEELAERANITWHFVSALERGTKGATLETLTSLASALEVSLSELFLGVGRPLPREAKRLSESLAGRTLDAQKRILRIVQEALAL